MPAAQAVLVAAQKALPILAKNLPKLWPLLLDSKNRDKLAGLAKDLAAATPKRKLAAKMQLTEMLAESAIEQAETEGEKERAKEWQHRARNMRLRLDMPIEGRQAKRQHRDQLRQDLAQLHEEMSAALR